MKTADEVRAHLVRRASEDEAFRASLIESPKTALESELGYKLPDDLEIKVHEDTPNVANFVLPQDSKVSDQSLHQVHGGQPWASEKRREYLDTVGG